MRRTGIVLLAMVAGSCAPTPPNPEVVAREQAQFAQLTAGKVAGAPMACLPSWRSDDMVVVDDNTIAFRDGPARTYVNHMQSGCLGIDHGRNALVTRTTSTQLCRGDIAEVVDTSARITVGSCVFGDFVPYMRPPGYSAAVETFQPIAIGLGDDMAADLHRRRELLVLNRKRRVRDDEAPHSLDDRKVGVHPIDRALEPLLNVRL